MILTSMGLCTVGKPNCHVNARRSSNGYKKGISACLSFWKRGRFVFNFLFLFLFFFFFNCVKCHFNKD